MALRGVVGRLRRLTAQGERHGTRPARARSWGNARHCAAPDHRYVASAMHGYAQYAGGKGTYYTSQRIPRRSSGYITNTRVARARRRPRRSASAWTCRTPSWSASGTSRTTSLRRDISRARCVRWCPGKTRAGSTSRSVRSWRSCSVGERERVKRSLCVWWLVGRLCQVFIDLAAC